MRLLCTCHHSGSRIEAIQAFVMYIHSPCFTASIELFAPVSDVSPDRRKIISFKAVSIIPCFYLYMEQGT
jgi:hypothetical protein